LEIKDIVNVVITRETNSKTTRDLQTIAILSVHDNYAPTEFYREYTSTTQMIEDGFNTDEYAYKAASLIFSQNPQVSKVIVGKLQGGDLGVDYVEGINTLLKYTSEWFFVITDATLDSDKEAIADFMETQDAVYIFSDSNIDTLNPENNTDIFSTLRDKTLVHSFGIYTKDETLVAAEAAWVGRFASAVIGSNTWIHKALVGLSTENFSPTEVAVLKGKNAHFYTKVGQDPSIEGNANTVGGEKIHVILGAIWLKIRIAERVWNLFYTKDRLNFTNASIELFKSEIFTVLSEAVVNKILTNEDGFVISVPDASKLTSAERASGYLRKVTFKARLAGAILFVDKIEGTVYT
jgi:hypothetical protein